MPTAGPADPAAVMREIATLRAEHERLREAAEVRTRYGHNERCNKHPGWGGSECFCGHDALAAALKGEAS